MHGRIKFIRTSTPITGTRLADSAAAEIAQTANGTPEAFTITVDVTATPSDTTDRQTDRQADG